MKKAREELKKAIEEFVNIVVDQLNSDLENILRYIKKFSGQKSKQ